MLRRYNHLRVNMGQSLDDLSEEPPHSVFILMQALINKVPQGAFLAVFHLDVQILQPYAFRAGLRPSLLPVHSVVRIIRLRKDKQNE